MIDDYLNNSISYFIGNLNFFKYKKFEVEIFFKIFPLGLEYNKSAKKSRNYYYL